MFPYTISFAMSIYANGKSLEHSNVEDGDRGPLLCSTLD